MRCEISLYRRRADRLAQRIGAVNAVSVENKFLMIRKRIIKKR